MNRKTIKLLLLLLKIVITILFVVVVNRTIPKDSTTLAKLIPLSLLIPVVILSGISTTLQAYRWYLYLKLLGLQPTIAQSFRSYLEGVLFGIITPGRAGELFRGFTLEPSWRKTASIAVVIEKISATIVLFVTGAIAWFLLIGNRGGELYSFGLAIATVFSICAIPLLPYLIRKFYPLVTEVRRRFLAALFLSIPIHLILLVQAILLIAPRTNLSIHESAAVSASAFSAMQFMPVTVANMGVREFCFSSFISIYQNDQAVQFVVLSSSLIIVIANLLLPAVPGIVILTTAKINGSNRKKCEQFQ